jgi:hypothetical protein
LLKKLRKTQLSCAEKSQKVAFSRQKIAKSCENHDFFAKFRSVFGFFFAPQWEKEAENSLQSCAQCTHRPLTHNDKTAALLDDEEQVKNTKRSKIQQFFGKPGSSNLSFTRRN